MGLVVRFFCSDCQVERRGVLDSLPLAVLVGRHPHKKDCPGGGDVWVQVYEGEYEDASPLIDDGGELRSSE